MDTGAIELDDERRASGEKLLATTDELGFGATAAGWVYSRDDSRWRFFLASAAVDTKGPLWIYERFMKVFQVVPLPPGITPLDIHIVSPNETFFRSFPFRIDAGETGVNASITLQNITISEFAVDFLFAYRMDGPEVKRVGSPRLFNMKVKQKLAA